MRWTMFSTSPIHSLVILGSIGRRVAGRTPRHVCEYGRTYLSEEEHSVHFLMT